MNSKVDIGDLGDAVNADIQANVDLLQCGANTTFWLSWRHNVVTLGSGLSTIYVVWNSLHNI